MTASGSGVGSISTVLFAHPGPELYGADRMVIESVRAVTEAGITAVVALPESGPLCGALEEVGARVELCPTPVLRKSMLSARGLGDLVRSGAGGAADGIQLLRRVRPDAVYVNTITVPGWLALGRLARRLTICHVHEAERAINPAVRLGLNLPLLAADRLIVNGQPALDVLQDTLPAVAARARVVLNGVVGPGRPRLARRDLTRELRLAYVGRLSPRKGVDVAVDTVAQLELRGIPAHLDLVGAVFPGYEWYEQDLRDQVRRLGLEDRVTFHGFVSPVWPLIQQSDIVLVPSRLDEPFGNTAVEAILAARPVVASDIAGLRAATDGYQTARRAVAGDSSSFADAVENLTADWRTNRAAAGQDCIKATERHSPARYRAQVLEAITTPHRRAGGPGTW